jgi:cytoskeletal protein CcmA (bactofilin family)
MFSKPNSSTPQPGAPATPGAAPAPQTSSAAPQPTPTPTASAAPEAARPAQRPQKGTSLIGGDMVLEGDISGGGEIQVEGTIKGDIRVEHVTVGDGGVVEGGIYADAVEVRGKVSGSITAKQVRLYGACQVDGDITHEQLAMETGAFFQGRSLRLQRQAASPATASATAPRQEATISPPRESANGSAAKSAPPAQA